MEKNVKEALRASGFAFKKQYGQNFITDEKLLERIVELSGADENSTVLEIGCGAGTLTRAVAQKVKFVRAYEIDEKLRPVLARTLAGVENAEVVFKDFLKIRLDELEKTLPPYIVIANLPYYVTTPLVMTFVEHSKKCLSLTVMVQEEVADRLCAAPATPEYGAITANIALRGRCEKVMRVSRENFYPVPNVDSAVVKITLSGGIETADAEIYKKVVRAAFASRRKTLENNLVNFFKTDRESAKKALSECGFDGRTRGETLSPEDFARLAEAVARYIIK